LQLKRVNRLFRPKFVRIDNFVLNFFEIANKSLSFTDLDQIDPSVKSRR